MTENRFEIIKSAIIDGARVIKDNEKKYTFATTFETATLINYRKALNELNDENNQLKSICKDHRDHAIDFKADCVRLEKENEELKKENDELQKELKALRKKYNDFSDTVDKRLKELKEND